MSKFLNCRNPKVQKHSEWSKVDCIHEYREAECDAREFGKQAPLPSKDDMPDWVEWDDVLKVRQQQKKRYISARTAMEKLKRKGSKEKRIARLSIAYASEMARYIVLFLLWTAIPPVRSQVFRHATLSDPPATEKPDMNDMGGDPGMGLAGSNPARNVRFRWYKLYNIVVLVN